MISVIVPYKDAERFLGRCLQSLEDQIGEFEFIVVNDGSTDGGPDVAAAYAKKDGRFISLDNEYKSGVSGARNTGLKHARGEWITFLDADDTMNGGAHKIFTAAVRICSGFNIIQFNHYRHYARINKTVLKYTNRPGNYDLKKLPILWCVVWNKLYRADFFKGIKFNETMQFGEDELFNVECLAKDGSIVCAEGITTTHYFEDRDSLSKIRAEKDILKLDQELVKAVKKNKDPEFRAAFCRRLSMHWAELFQDVLTGRK